MNAVAVSFRHVQCIAIARVDFDDGTHIDILCQIPGCRPRQRRSVGPMLNDEMRAPDLALDGAPLCHTFEDFEAWVHERYPTA